MEGQSLVVGIMQKGRGLEGGEKNRKQLRGVRH